MRHAFWTGVWMLSGCGPAPDTTASRTAYLKVVSQRQIQPEAGLTECVAILDPALAGDCALHVVSVEARRRDGRPSKWCDQVPEGTWRHECWFVAGEAARRGGRLDEAASLCMEAGPFKDDCAQHLWQSEVHRLIHRRGPEAFSETLPEAVLIHSRWSPRLSDGSDFDARFWAKFFQNGFEGRGGRVDLTHCDALVPPHADRCVRAATELYGRELAPRLGDAGQTVCSVEEPLAGSGWSAALVRWVPAQPDLRLDAVVQDLRHQCP